VLAIARRTQTVLERGYRVAMTRTGRRAVLVETGFLSNQGERRLLSSRAYQRTIARGLTAGVVAFVGPT
jgi:N-acetylmuramoyl-L-alanine amidase